MSEEPPLPPPLQPPPEEPLLATSFASAPSRPAALLVQNALRPECSVDFPQITEICERLEMQPSELKDAVAVLAAALRERRHPLRVKLKALTIANEMLYNPRAVQEFGDVDGLREALEVLRQVRGGELGPAMDENVRMLATEIEVKCFHEKLPPGTGSWTSFTKAMSSDFEKARKVAKKNFQHFSQKAEKHMEKAERVFERGATKFMQEAENLLVGPGTSADDGASKGQRPSLTQEEEELQWALRASLEEAQRSRRNESEGRARKREARTDQKDTKIEDLPQKVSEAHRRVKATEELLNRQLAMQAKKSKERSELNAKNEELSALAGRLAEELYEAEANLLKLKQKRQGLEEQLAIALSMQVNEPLLRHRLQELEAQVAAAKCEFPKDAVLQLEAAPVAAAPRAAEAPEPNPETQETGEAKADAVEEVKETAEAAPVAAAPPAAEAPEPNPETQETGEEKADAVEEVKETAEAAPVAAAPPAAEAPEPSPETQETGEEKEADAVEEVKETAEAAPVAAAPPAAEAPEPSPETQETGEEKADAVEEVKETAEVGGDGPSSS